MNDDERFDMLRKRTNILLVDVIILLAIVIGIITYLTYR